MKKIKTIEFKEKKMIKRNSLNKYLNEELSNISIHSENNPEIGIIYHKHNYCQHLGINKQRTKIKKINDLKHINNYNDEIEKIINLNSNENSIDGDVNEVIEIEPDTKNLNNNLCKEIKLEENNDIILLSDNDDDDNNHDGIKKINIVRKIKYNKKYNINEINSKDFQKKNKLNNNDEFNGINNKKNNINIKQSNNNYKHHNYFKKIKNDNKYVDNYGKMKREKEIKDSIRIIDLSISDNKSKKKFEKNNIKNKNIYLFPELCLFYFLVEEYGIENVIDSIYDYEENKNQKKNLDLCIQVIKQIYGENKLIVMAVQASIFIMKTDLNDIFLKKNIDGLIRQDKADEDENRKIDINTHNSNKFENKNISEKNEKSISIISHYNRYKDKKIYKYRVGHLLGKFVIFYCFDRKCESIGIFNLETKSFRLKKKHNLKHSRHDYIINYDKSQDYILEEMIEKNYCDCQIYKEDQVMIVRYYS